MFGIVVKFNIYFKISNSFSKGTKYLNIFVNQVTCKSSFVEYIVERMSTTIYWI